jgi:hypothetical protein
MAMTEIKIGKQQYHLNREMSAWCYDHIGHGGHVYADPGDWDKRTWAVWSMFGETTFTFKHDRDATAFALVWT